MSARRGVVLAALSLGAALAGAAPQGDATKRKASEKPAARANAGAEHWEGTLTTPSGVALRLVIHVAKGGTAATLDSPDEGLEGLKLAPFSVGKGRLAFELRVTGAKYEGKLGAGEMEAAGTWAQRGASLPLTFRKTKTPTPMPRIVGPEQVWEGKLEIGGGLGLRIVFHVGKGADGKLMATMDSPDQGAKGLKVDAVGVDAMRLTFELKRLRGKYEGKLNAEGTEAVGTWSQGGMSFPLTLKRTEKASEIRRPQTPKPPFPYKEVEASYDNAAAGVALAGTLTVPSGPGPFPAVILISGSGAQDRDETIFEHRPFKVLADALTRRGIAVLRVDDRGVGGSSGSTTATSDDFAADVRAGIAWLKSRREIDPKRIGLVGHSEGGIIAPLVASRSPDVAFIVLLAGTGLPGGQIVQLQARAIMKAMGGDERAMNRELELQRNVLEIAGAEKDEKAIDARIRAVVKQFENGLPEADRKEFEKRKDQLEGQLALVKTPWFRYFLAHDPRPILAKVRCPVLALIGEKDLQVPPGDNLPQIEAALKKAGNTRFKVAMLPGLNHLFQNCRTGAPAEYAQIEETFAPAALELIGGWIGEQAGGR